MLQETIAAICEGNSYIKKIVVLESKPSSGRFICRKGERLMDRLFYVAKGIFHIHEKGGEKIVATDGTLLYLPADIEYTSYWEQTAEASYITFNYNLYDTEGKSLHLSNHIIEATNDANGAVYQILRECTSTYICHEKHANLVLQAYFYKLLYTVLRQQTRKTMKKDKNSSEIYKAIICLDDRYMSDITTEELAEMCNISVASFRRIFKKCKGMSPMKYKQILRMNHAKDMLESGVYTVSEVAELMNCTDLSHFNRQYNAAFGRNPSDSKLVSD